jgi:serralysin
MGRHVKHYYGTKNPDWMIGFDNSDDVFHGSQGADTMFGFAGIDTVDYWDSRTLVVVDLNSDGHYGDAEGDVYSSIENAVGSQFDDYLFGSASANMLEGRDGDDRIFGRESNDKLYGQAGDDDLWGGADRDWLYGGSGNDRLYADRFDFIADGGSGIDRLFVDAEGADVTVILNEDGTGLLDFGADEVALRGIEKVDAGAGNDRLYGNALDNVFYGLDGADQLFGGAGNDYLHGGAQRDRLDGGLGDDSLVGAADIDTFVFANSESDLDADRIVDFQPGQDWIDLSATERFGGEDFDDLLDEASQVGSDVVIDFGDGSLTLVNAQLNALSESDFIF